MTFEQAISHASSILPYGRSEALILLSHVLVKDKAYLYTHPHEDIDGKQAEEYADAVQKRAVGMPLQYVCGHAGFMSLDFLVNTSVLIPRPDTEILVQAVLDRYIPQKVRNVPSMPKPGHESFCEAPQILDLCTGSGCIAVSLAYYIDNCFITASDCSVSALEVAKQNAALNGVSEKITFKLSDIFNAFAGMKFDVIVSNPPYIASGDIAALQTEIRDHEPVLALDGGPDGMFFISEIISRASIFLKPGGMLALEVGQGQADAAMGLITAAGCYHGAKKVDDFSGIERVVLTNIL